MAVLKAFRALRPTPKYASKVAALPYDVMNSDEARRMVFGNPYSFLHVDKAEIDLPKSVDIYDDRVYEYHWQAGSMPATLVQHTKPDSR